MSTPLPLIQDLVSDTQRMGGNHVQWLREPLLHFVLLGTLLFGIDHWLVMHRDDPHTIVVGPAVDSEAVEEFAESRGREPNEAELKALHQVWLDNEVLYREGLAMQVDKGDDAIRERVIFKALSVIDANVTLPKVDDQALKAWFEARREKYDEPTRYDFEEAALVGTADQAAVADFVKALNAGASGDAQAGLRVFKGRPEASLAPSYGPDFAKTLAAMPINYWQSVQTRDGWRAMRVTQIIAGKPADYDNLRGIVYQDWKDDQAAQQRTAAVRALAKKYHIVFEASHEH